MASVDDRMNNNNCIFKGTGKGKQGKVAELVFSGLNRKNYHMLEVTRVQIIGGRYKGKGKLL